ncbi:MAG: hypothetical protein ABIQ01_08535 [Pseudolysinimonas sp.]
MPGTRRASTVAAACLIAVVGLGLSGCWPAPDPAVGPSFPAEPQNREPLDPITEPDVLDYCPDVPVVHYPGIVAPYEFVYACRAGEHRPSDGVTTYGSWQVAYRIVDPHSLLEVYSLPNDTRRGGACPDHLADPLILWVHERGTVVAIYAPVDECGFPRDDAVTAYANADRHVLVEFDQGVPLDERDTPAEH